LDILGAIPVNPVRVRAWVQRPGKRISLLVAEIAPTGEGDRRAVARHWWNLTGYLASVDWRPQPEDQSGSIGPGGLGVTSAEIFDRKASSVCARRLCWSSVAGSIISACFYIDTMRC
jgi:hypothetical protein